MNFLSYDKADGYVLTMKGNVRANSYIMAFEGSTGSWDGTTTKVKVKCSKQNEDGKGRESLWSTELEGVNHFVGGRVLLAGDEAICAFTYETVQETPQTVVHRYNKESGELLSKHTLEVTGKHMATVSNMTCDAETKTLWLVGGYMNEPMGKKVNKLLDGVYVVALNKAGEFEQLSTIGMPSLGKTGVTSMGITDMWMTDGKPNFLLEGRAYSVPQQDFNSPYARPLIQYYSILVSEYILEESTLKEITSIPVKRAGAKGKASPLPLGSLSNMPYGAGAFGTDEKISLLCYNRTSPHMVAKAGDDIIYLSHPMGNPSTSKDPDLRHVIRVSPDGKERVYPSAVVYKLNGALIIASKDGDRVYLDRIDL